MDQLDPPTDTLDWTTISALLASAAGDEAGHWKEPTQHAEGVWTVGYPVLSDQAIRVVEQLYELDVVVDFDWPTWMERRGGELHRDPDLLAEASLGECRRMLIALARGDRFNDGVLLDAFRNGTMARIAARTAELAGDPG